MIVACNWKMNKGPYEAKDFLEQLKGELGKVKGTFSHHHLIFLVPALCAETVNTQLTHQQSNILTSWGGQNCSWQNSGALTGENSPYVLQQMGAQFCIVGHSERRQIFGEQNETLSKKVAATQKVGLTALLCVGETLEDRQTHQTFKVLEAQLSVGLSQCSSPEQLYIAYEPVWAIGTGHVAKSHQVAEAHQFIWEWLQKRWPSAQIPLLYGGSVKSDHIQELSQVPHVEGFLVGGASLEVPSLVQLILNLRNTK